MMDQQIARKVTATGAKKPIKGELYLPNAIVFGPSAVVAMMESLSSKQFDITDEDTKQTWKVTLNNSEYLAVYGTKNGIRKFKSGNYFIKELTWCFQLRKKKGKLEQLPKIKFMYSGTVNGQVTQANGEYQWLRSGR